MSKKWYSYFVVTDASAAAPATADRPAPEPRRAIDLAPEPAAAAEGPPPPAPGAAPDADLALVYESAKIVPPPHGYTVLKVADMLRSEHLHSLPADVRRKSVLVALDAAGVTSDDIVQDAILRDRALDTYERVLQQHVHDLAAKTAAENRRLEEEIARRVAELRAQIDENTRALAAEQAELAAWRARKHQEEALIAEAVGHFVTENPITRAPRAAEGGGDTDAR